MASPKLLKIGIKLTFLRSMMADRMTTIASLDLVTARQGHSVRVKLLGDSGR